MFAYPKQAEFNRVVPKTKIYAHAKVPKRVKELFVTQVDEIVWKYKLSPETINLPARRGINEIQVFELKLKTAAPDDAPIVHAIDKAVPFPVLFELTNGRSIIFATSYKRPSEADHAKWVIEASFHTEPLNEPVQRLALPVAVDLANLHDQLIRSHIPIAPRTGEELRDHIARFNAISEKRISKARLLEKLAKEQQFNRRVELNAEIRSISLELESLTR